MESQLSALRKEIGEKQWQNIEKVLEGDFDEDEWERVVGEALAGVDDDAGQEQGEDEGDEKPSWDDDDEAYGNYEEEGYGEEGGDVDMDMDMGMDEEEGPVNMVRSHTCI
jgi:protein KRI1